jgi:hypothetical protein
VSSTVIGLVRLLDTKYSKRSRYTVAPASACVSIDTFGNDQQITSFGTPRLFLAPFGLNNKDRTIAASNSQKMWLRMNTGEDYSGILVNLLILLHILRNIGAAERLHTQPSRYH